MFADDFAKPPPQPGPPASPRRLLTPLLLAGAFFAAAASCERISFYSTGRSETPPETTTTSSAAGGSASSTGGSTPKVTRAALLGSVATCTADLLDAFRGAADELETAAAAAHESPEALDKARAAWVSAMDVWQKAELFQIGPAAPTSSPGGQALREHVYSWPLVSRCLIEQNIASKAYEAADFAQKALVNTRGLAAAEYLLFYEGSDNACSPSTNINANGSWAALGETEIAHRKARYAAVVAAGVAGRARELADAWKAGGGDFKAQLANAGSGGSVFTSDQMGLNAVSDAMFYIEIYVKDLKLARPLGILNCDSETCPDTVESRFARRSKRHLHNNLVAFRMLMVGCGAEDSIGFRDLLASVGAGATGEAMLAGVDAALEAESALPGEDLGQNIVDDLAGAQKIHAGVKAITDVLKTDFVTILDLEPPKTVEGDND